MPRLARHFFLLCALGVLGCGEPSPAPPSTLTDDLGRSLDVEVPVENVLTLAPNLTELLFAIGRGEALVGASAADTYPPGLDSLPQFGTYPLDAEAVVALQPDLVLATDQVNNPDDADALAEAGVPTYFFRFTSIEDVPRAARRLGELLDAEASADSAAAAFEARMARLTAQTSSLDRPRVLLLIGGETLFAFGDASYTQQLIEIAGGESVTAHFSGEAVTLSEEFVLEAMPDVIVGAFGPDYEPAKLTALHPAWHPIPAVREGHVYGIDPDLLLRPGPRLADGAETLARLLHPELGAGERVSGRMKGRENNDPQQAHPLFLTLSPFLPLSPVSP